MPEQSDESEPDAPTQRRWTAPLTFFLIVAISAGAYAVALLDRGGAGEAAPTVPTPPPATTSMGPPVSTTFPAPAGAR